MKELKPKKCKSCGSMFKPFSSLAKVCSMACSLDYIGAEKQKAEAKKSKQKKKEFYQKDIRWQHKQCQPVFNKLRRLQEFKWFKDRGIEPYCISCGGELGGDTWACGHFRSVGSNSQLRYSPENTYLQHNNRCNKNLSGDINGTATTKGYKQGLVDRFGEDLALWITDYCEIHSDPVKWDWEKMETMRAEWNAEIRKLEKERA